jgi:Holliday junction resolvase RusA-like endonuclease
MLLSGVIPLAPKPAVRPRFTCRGRFAVAYSDKGYAAWLDSAASILRELPRPDDWDETLPFELGADFKVEKPKTSKLTYPKPDTDNYLKSLMDAVTKAGGIWLDDSQVVELGRVRKVFTTDPDEVGTHFTIKPTEA